MTAEYTFLHLSDTHLLEDDGELLGARPAASLQRVLARIAALPVTPQFCLVTGDLAHESGPAGYATLHRLLAPLEEQGRPLLVGMGNHDRRASFREGFLGDISPSDQPYYYSQTIGGLRVIMLDSLVPGAVDGELGASQLAWLREELRQPTLDGTLIALHHPVAQIGMPWAAGALLRDADAFGAAIKGSDVLGIVAGHIHLPSLTFLAGVPVVTAPAVVFQILPGLATAEIVQGNGFALCVVRDGALTVTPIMA